MSDVCHYPRCRRQALVTHLDVLLCEKHLQALFCAQGQGKRATDRFLRKVCLVQCS